ncbi:hypothetical protein O1611_g2363 [Lasiodiplodia mahajangana]|uniref:Uncharacterized protein n=1 Tax=Lasiodiplodia mahajangana TaxID=1108764 RepID=A0ACC2JV30_9PEZI|nr:hypothetical protein O1611_g2363 [Lasiodiplodia mahajangana]
MALRPPGKTGEITLSHESEDSVMQLLNNSPNIPDLLITAPLAINLLGSMRLLAFSDAALRVNLPPPQNGPSPFLYPSLSGAMQQGTNLAAEAFHVANINMRSIETQLNSSFGPNSHAQDIIRCLDNPKLAERSLGKNMQRLEQGIKKCAAKAEEIRAKFATFNEFAAMIQMSMAHGISQETLKRDKLKEQARKAASAKAAQEKGIRSLNTQIEEAKQDLNKTWEQFNKDIKKRESSALAKGITLDITRTISDAISGSFEVVNNSLTAINTVAVAGAGVLAGSPIAALPIRSAPSLEKPSETPVNTNHEGALIVAEPLYGDLQRLKSLLVTLEENTADDCQSVTDEASEVSSRLDLLNETLTSTGYWRSEMSFKAQGVVTGAVSVAKGIVKVVHGRRQEADSNNHNHQDSQDNARNEKNTQASEAGDEHIENRDGGPTRRARGLVSRILGMTESKSGDGDARKELQQLKKKLLALVADAKQLCTFAAGQRSQGLGTAPGAGSATDVPSKADQTGYDRVMLHRQQRLLIQQKALQDFREQLDKFRSEQQDRVEAVAELQSRIDTLNLKEATIQENLEVLGKAMDVMTGAENSMQRLVAFFSFFADIISVTCADQTTRFLESVGDGVIEKTTTTKFSLEYTTLEAQAIKPAFVTLQGYVDCTRMNCNLYCGIAKAYINPCMDMAKALPISATPQRQEEAKMQLQKFAAECSQEIGNLAEEDIAKWNGRLSQRNAELESMVMRVRSLE